VFPMASRMLLDSPLFMPTTSYSGVTYAPERPPSTMKVEAFT
jgi:hypothetical protein